MTKKGNEDFKHFNKCHICDNIYIEGDVKIRDVCYITGKCRHSTLTDCNINNKLNFKVPIVFCNLKNYDSHLIMQELGKLTFKIYVIPNGFVE